jgi:hypothetical protein
MKIIAIDPGTRGSIAFFNNGKVVSIINIPLTTWGTKTKVPDREELRTFIVNFNPDLIVIEKVSAAPKDGIASASHFLLGLGILYGACASFDTVMVQPQKWKALAGLINKVKALSTVRACSLYPESEQFIDGYPNKVDRADAVLIGHYAVKFFSKTP